MGWLVFLLAPGLGPARARARCAPGLGWAGPWENYIVLCLALLLPCRALLSFASFCFAEFRLALLRSALLSKVKKGKSARRLKTSKLNLFKWDGRSFFSGLTRARPEPGPGPEPGLLLGRGGPGPGQNYMYAGWCGGGAKTPTPHFYQQMPGLLVTAFTNYRLGP